MVSIRPCELPGDALLRKYFQEGTYTDCYMVDVMRPITQAAYVEAFYTTWVFKLERWILAWLVARPSTDRQARDLAEGKTSSFAAWRVEGREANPLLLCDFRGRTRSWLMIGSSADGARLYFGSAVVPLVEVRSGESKVDFVVRAVPAFHILYSRVLLDAVAALLAIVTAY